MANIFTSLKAAVAPQSIVRAIHNDFDTATDKILAEANAILAEKVDFNSVDQLQKLGFTKAKKVTETRNLISQQDSSREKAELIKYYKDKYPFQKFITESVVMKICKKYGLVCGYVSYYKGDVPEKNIREIASFRLLGTEWLGSRPWSWTGYRHEEIYETGIYVEGYDRQTVYKEQMKICAPIKEFDTKNMDIQSGYKLGVLKDPVVLQAVRGGYLIVSKWGIEAEDKMLN